jgi:hypothetical protein
MLRRSAIPMVLRGLFVAIVLLLRRIALTEPCGRRTVRLAIRLGWRRSISSVWWRRSVSSVWWRRTVAAASTVVSGTWKTPTGTVVPLTGKATSPRHYDSIARDRERKDIRARSSEK